RRSAVVADSERKLLEAKEKMRQGKRAAFQRKLEMIEAGESEEEEDDSLELTAKPQ
ncbi:MAG: hypothetical protein JNJ93_08325, partial [Acinetobacter sp.]|nr:hypothetical protein [Acinetobacter sp.]